MNKNIEKILKDLPNSPGVYKMKDNQGVVLYIGKAKNLKKRVRHYFRKNNHTIRTQKLVEKIDDIEIICVDTELESILLETNLIKQFRPKYNILMKDDKNYVYIKITREDFPRIQLAREVKRDGAKYIGPKPAAHKVKSTLKILKKLFPFRHCNLNISFEKEDKRNNKEKKHKIKLSNKTIKYPCLDFYIKRCCAPCIGKITPEEYSLTIKRVENFLNGNADEILNDLEDEMKELATLKEYEKAGKIRDKIQIIKEILEKQKISSGKAFNQDIINYCVFHEQAYFNLFQVRDGKMIGQENFILKAPFADESEEDSEILSAFIHQYYELATDIPKEIIIPHIIDDRNTIEKNLGKIMERKVKIIVPQIGKKHKLLKMSLNNARIFADRNKPKWYEESKINKKSAEKLQKILKIKNPLKRIECYDISHLSGTNTVGSMVVFENGIPQKSMYRKFKIKTVSGKPDDYKCMEEVLRRRLIKISDILKQKDFAFKKARKIDKKEIEKILEEELTEEKLKNFYIFEKIAKNKKNNRLAAFAELIDHNAKTARIKNFNVLKEFRGQKLGQSLIKKIIEKSKSKRIYIICKQELKEYYLLMGFEEIKKIPEEFVKDFEKTKNQLIVAFDKIKHKPDKSFIKIPNLIVIDGGKGQLSAAKNIIEDLNIKIPYIAIAKQLEEIFIPNKNKSIKLEKNNDALKLIQKARDEAHRFAISYNKQLRKKNMFK